MSQTLVGSRVEPRYEIDGELGVIVFIEPEDHRAEPIELNATLLNLSASGAKMSVPTALEQDRLLKIKLIVEKLGVSFYLQARVCWAERDGAASIVGCALKPNIPEGVLSHLAAGGRLNRRDQDRRTAAIQVGLGRTGIRLWSREKAELRNYAAGGVCLETGKTAQLGETLRVRFATDQVDGVDVTVRWVMQQGERFLMGCEYKDPAGFAVLKAMFD